MMSWLNKLPLDLRHLLWRRYLNLCDKAMYRKAMGLKQTLYFKHYLETAAFYGHLHLLKWLDTKWHISSDTVNYVIAGGHMEILEWIHQKYPFLFNYISFAFALSCGSLKIIEWIHQRYPNMIEESKGHIYINWRLEVLQWIQDKV